MISYFFVDSDGTESVSNYPPIRHPNNKFWVVLKSYDNDIVNQCIKVNNIESIINYEAITELPKNTIQTLFGKKITWKDPPIKIVYED